MTAADSGSGDGTGLSMEFAVWLRNSILGERDSQSLLVTPFICHPEALAPKGTPQFLSSYSSVETSFSPVTAHHVFAAADSSCDWIFGSARANISHPCSPVCMQMHGFQYTQVVHSRTGIRYKCRCEQNPIASCQAHRPGPGPRATHRPKRTTAVSVLFY